jgi:hypothetical protein
MGPDFLARPQSARYLADEKGSERGAGPEQDTYECIEDPVAYPGLPSIFGHAFILGLDRVCP